MDDRRQYYDYNKRNISVDICDNQVMMAAENFSTQRQFSISGNKYTINNM
jgi:hypothetical protein